MQLSSKYLYSLATSALLLLLTVCARAATLNVPADYATIQAAINAAKAGDVVVVAAGTYHESVDWENKDLTLLGAGPDQTIVDPGVANGGPGGRCLFAAGLTSASLIDGFTLQNGQVLGFNQPDGGGILANGSSLTVSNCILRGNSAVGAGGGIATNSNSGLTLRKCTIVGNQSRGRGAGMRNISNSGATIIECVFQGNRNLSVGGGGLADEQGSNSTLIGCLFTGNIAAVRGGGIAEFNSSSTITGCVFTGNHGATGGAINLASSNSTVKDCAMSGNSADGSGGAVNVEFDCACTMTNCTITANSSASFLSAVAITSNRPSLIAVAMCSVATEIFPCSHCSPTS